MSVVATILLLSAVGVTYLRLSQVASDRRADLDSYSHLRISRLIWQSKAISAGYDCYYPGKSIPYSYPPLLHILLALFFRGQNSSAGRSFSIEMIWFGAIILGVVSVFGGSYSLVQAVVFSALYVLTSLVNDDCNVITPRPIGMLIFALIVIGSAGALEGWEIQPQVLQVLLMTLLLFTHRMATQVLLSLVISYSLIGVILDINWWFVYNFGIAVVLASVVAGKLFFRVVKDHFMRLKLHIRHGDQWIGDAQFGDYKKILRMSPVLGLWLAYLWTSASVGQFGINSLAQIPQMAIVVSLALSVGWKWGSGERHVIFASPIIIYLVVPHLGEPLIASAGVLCAVIYLREWRKSIYVDQASGGLKLDSPNMKELIKYVREGSPQRYLLIPDRTITFVTMMTGKVFYSGGHSSMAVAFDRQMIKSALNDPPTLRRQISKIGPEAIIFRKTKILPEPDLVIPPNYLSVFSNSEYTVFHHS